MIAEIMRKDLEQNRTALAVYAAGAIAFPALAHVFQKSKSVESYLGLIFGLVILGAPLLFGFWFIGQEKAKGTLRILRILPIPEAKLVMAKLALNLGLTAVVLAAVLLGDPWLLRALGASSLEIGFAPVLWMITAGCFCSIVCTCVFIAFEQKVAMQIGYGIMLALTVVSVLAAKYLDHGSGGAAAVRRLLEHPAAPLVALLVLIPVSAAAIRFGGNLIAWRDWSELEEA